MAEINERDLGIPHLGTATSVAALLAVAALGIGVLQGRGEVQPAVMAVGLVATFAGSVALLLLDR